MPYFKNPQTGNVGEVPHDKADEAVADGMIPVTYMHNPETKGTGWVETSRAREALDDGMEIAPTPQQDVEVPEMSKGMAAIRGAAQGASFGFGDEAQAALRTPFNMSDKESVTDTYKRLRDEQRAQNELAQKQHPWTYGVSEVVPQIAAAATGIGAVRPVIGDVINEGAMKFAPKFAAKATEEAAELARAYPEGVIPLNELKAFAPNWQKLMHLEDVGASVGAGTSIGAAQGALNEAGHQDEMNIGNIAKAGALGGALGGVGAGAGPALRTMAPEFGAGVGDVGRSIAKGVEDIGGNGGTAGALLKTGAADILGGGGTFTGGYLLSKGAGKILPSLGERISNTSVLNKTNSYGGGLFSGLSNYLSPKEKQKKAEDDFQNGTNNTYSKDGQ